MIDLLVASQFLNRMWHSITDKVEELLAQPDINSNPRLMMQVYTDFVSQFEGRINALRLAVIITNITERLQGTMGMFSLLLLLLFRK